MLGCKGLGKWKTSSFASILWEVIDIPANYFTAVSLIKFNFSFSRKLSLSWVLTYKIFKGEYVGNDSEIYIIELGEGLGA